MTAPFELQITNNKHQIPNKSQMTMSKSQTGAQRPVWNLLFWLLEFVCYLAFEIWSLLTISTDGPGV
jgi:hypothetical protein